MANSKQSMLVRLAVRLLLVSGVSWAGFAAAPGLAAQPPAKEVDRLEAAAHSVGLINLGNERLNWFVLNKTKITVLQESPVLFGAVAEYLPDRAGGTFNAEVNRWQLQKPTDPEKFLELLDVNGTKVLLVQISSEIRQEGRYRKASAVVHGVFVTGDFRIQVNAVKNGPALGSPDDKEAAAAAQRKVEQATYEAAKEFTRKLAQAMAGPDSRRSFKVPMRPARPITPAMIDQFLDHLAGLLQSAVDAPGGRDLTPLDCDMPASVPAGSPPDWGQCAELARSVYEQVRAMQTQANRGLFALNAPQKERMKAFLHWVEWIQKRGSQNVLRFADGKLYWIDPNQEPSAVQSWEPFPAQPRWPLMGPVGKVDPPNLRDIVDEGDAAIWNAEYAVFFTKTITEVAVAAVVTYFTAGLMSTSYLYLAGRATSPIALAVLSGVYRAGPVLVATYQNYEALSNWKKLTWDQRWGRLSIIFLAAVHAGKEPPKLPQPAAGVRQAPVPEALPEEVPGDNSLRVPKTPPADEIVEIKATVPGATEGQPPGPGTEVTIKARAVKVNGETRYFHADTGEPIIPAGEDGYAEWRSLTGRHYGQNTGKTSLRQALDGTKYESEAQAIVDEFMRPQADRAALGKRFVGMLQQMVQDPDIPKVQGNFAAAPEMLANTNYILQIKNGLGEVNDVAVSVGADGQVKAAEVLPPGPSRVVTDSSSPAKTGTPPPSPPRPISPKTGLPIPTPTESPVPPKVLADAETALAKIKAGEPRPWPGKWGSRHGNKEINLPRFDAGGSPVTYSEYYLPKNPGDTGTYGPNRLVVGSDGNAYVSTTHYGQEGDPPFVFIGPR